MSVKQTLSLHEYQDFRSKYANWEFGTQGFGSAFYYHFAVKINLDEKTRDDLIIAGDEDARQKIRDLFDFV